MLVLTRKCQEVVVIAGADGINVLLKVTVLGIDNGKVRLGFEAPEDVPVHRLEVWERILRVCPEKHAESDWTSGLVFQSAVIH